MKTLVDLRLEFHNETGWCQWYINNDPYTNIMYVQWLEDQVLKQMNKEIGEVTSEPLPVG